MRKDSAIRCEYVTSIILITLPSQEAKFKSQVLMSTSSDRYQSIVDMDISLEEKMSERERFTQSLLCKAPTLSACLDLQPPSPEKSRSRRAFSCALPISASLSVCHTLSSSQIKHQYINSQLFSITISTELSQSLRLAFHN